MDVEQREEEERMDRSEIIAAPLTTFRGSSYAAF